MKCANIDCDIELTKFETDRIIPNKFTKHRLCIKCRTYNARVIFINCLECGIGITPKKEKLYCDMCFKERRKAKAREKYAKIKYGGIQ